MNEIELELRERLMRWIVGEDSLATFQDWFVPAFWDESGLDASLRDFVHEVQLITAELTSGAWSGAEARSLLSDVLTHHAVRATLEDATFFVLTESTAEIARSSFIEPVVHRGASDEVDTRLEEVTA